MKTVKSRPKLRARYRRMPGMKYGTRVDFPRKCEGCGGPTAAMKRHGYQAREGNEYYWKKFMCMTCGKIMKRVTGYSPVLPSSKTHVFNMDKLNPKRLKDDLDRIAAECS